MALTNRANGAPVMPAPINPTDGFIKAVGTLMRDPSFQHVAKLVGEIDQLKADGKRKEEQLQTLSATIGERDLRISTCLGTFRKDAEQQDALLAEERARVEQLEREVKGLKAQVGRHKEAEATAKKQEAEAKELLKAEKADHKKTQDAKAKVGKELSDKKGEIAELKDRLQEANRVAQQTQAALEECEEKGQELVEDLNYAEDELKELRSFAVELVPEDLPATITRLHNLWAPAIHLIHHYFTQDVSDLVQQHNYAWTSITRFPIPVRLPPLPRTNTPAAKTARIAAILTILTTLIDALIFQTTHLLTDPTELNHLLLLEARACPAKEAFLRAMLRKQRPDEQTAIAAKRVKDVVKEVGDCVHELLPVAQRGRFDVQLEIVVAGVQETWRGVNGVVRKVEPTVNVGVGGMEWVPLALEVGAEAVPAADPKTEPAAGGPQDQIYLVVCPGMYAVDEHGVQQVLPGVALMQSQAEAAQREVQDVPAWPAAGRAPTGRVGQGRSRRRDSVLEGFWNPLAKGSFLPAAGA